MGKSQELPGGGAVGPQAAGHPPRPPIPTGWSKGRLWAAGAAGMAIAAFFYKPILLLVDYAAHSDVQSHILLVPLISGYLLFIGRDKLPRSAASSPGFASLFFLLGAATFLGARRLNQAGISPATHYYLTLMTIAFLCFVVAAASLFLGSPWVRSAAFPLLFLLFAVPLPENVLEWLETGLKIASAEMADLLFTLAGIPFLRDAQVFQLPGITMEVARECSGIRSSWVLFMTSFLAAYLFLRSPWKRAALVAVVIPLGILRNGFRILVIGFLCVHYGPQMINSPIHRRGGPLFFVLSLVPLLGFLWWMRNREQKSARKAQGQAVPAIDPQYDRDGPARLQ